MTETRTHARKVPLATRTWVALARAYRHAYRRQARTLAEIGTTVPQFDLLATLLRGPSEGLRMGDVSERLLVTEGNVTALVDRLEASGHVSRRKDPFDRRAVLVRLTELGRKTVAESIPRVEMELESVFSSIPEASMRETQRLLREVSRRAKRL